MQPWLLFAEPMWPSAHSAWCAYVPETVRMVPSLPMRGIFPLQVGVLAGSPAVIGTDFTTAPSRSSVSGCRAMSTLANRLPVRSGHGHRRQGAVLHPRPDRPVRLDVPRSVGRQEAHRDRQREQGEQRDRRGVCLAHG
ncbi:hypothetical protein DRB96_38245 [Streptomyces sp. ICC1]|nr:hypothetical protein DRB96_38245 [Streptomyces sp. ICC1]